jgi:hypothetical protein
MPNMKTTLLIAGFGLLTVLHAARTPAIDTRVFELRTYHTASAAKLEALHTRFRDHSIGLLEKHGMTLVGFWVPTDAEKGAGNTLVYLVAHKSREAAAASWKAFGADPEWKTVKADSEKDGVLAEKVDSVFMSPTDYSAMK